MKKFILTAAALTFGVFAYAQDIAGSPTAGYVAPLPGAGAGANTGLSEQYGNAQRVRVRQAGTEQSVYTRQDNGTGGGGNMAEVRQTGSVMASSGFRNAAEVLQSGTANSSLTRQEGDLNNAVTRQGQNNTASTDNKAYIRQGVANQAEGNRAAIDQDGNRNRASILQTYDNSDAWTRQNGDDNKSMITQDAGPNGTDGHEGWNYQTGNSNESTIMQSGAGGRNVAQNIQAGDFNKIKQIQVTTATAGEAGNTAVARQGAISAPGGSELDFQAYLPNLLDIRTFFEPFANVYYIPSGDDYNLAKQTQGGANNRAELAQRGGTIDGSNYGEQNQISGNDNVATMGQGHYYDGEASNYARQDQTGNGNLAAVLSSGSGQKILQDQRGNDNNAWSSQLGRDHKANIHQRGDNNSAGSAQRGIGNKLLIVQHDGQSYTGLQNVIGSNGNPFLGDGGANQIDVLQVGPDGNFGPDYAIDCAFDDPMDLEMEFPVPMANTPDICIDCNN